MRAKEPLFRVIMQIALKRAFEVWKNALSQTEFNSATIGSTSICILSENREKLGLLGFSDKDPRGPQPSGIGTQSFSERVLPQNLHTEHIYRI